MENKKYKVEFLREERFVVDVYATLEELYNEIPDGLSDTVQEIVELELLLEAECGQ